MHPAASGRWSPVLDALWESIAALDHHGIIIGTNDAWATFSQLNGGRPEATGIGVNYLDVCDRSGAQFVATGIRAILSGECSHFDVTYACPSPLEDRWFMLKASRELDGGAVVSHTNITARMLVDERGRVAVDEDPMTGLPTLATGLRMLEAALAETSTSGVLVMVATIKLPMLVDVTLSHGRLARDEILVQVAARARRLLRSGDFLIRAGPSSFLFVARQVDDRDGEQLIESLGQALSPSLQVGPFELSAAVALEVVTSSEMSTVEGLLQRRSTMVRSALAPGLIAADEPPTPAVISEDDDGIRGAIVGSPLPMLVVSLPDQRVRAANRAASDLVGLSPGKLMRRHAHDLFHATDRSSSTLDLSALAAGALDSYRARRTLIGATGPVDASIWVRAIPRRSGAMALLLVLPADHDDQFQLPMRALMGPLSVDLASGTMDEAGCIATISRSNPGVLQIERQNDLGTRHLISHVHPQDQARLRTTLARFREDGHDVVIVLRIRHAHRGWVTSDCHLFATGDDEHGEPIGFVLAEANVGGPVTSRIAQLEQHLTRIAAEAHAAGLASGLGVPPPEERPTVDLDRLTPRQREIVTRLLDGQRVPTIAAALFVSRSTVRNHLAGVYRAFEVHSQADLIELLRVA